MTEYDRPLLFIKGWRREKKIPSLVNCSLSTKANMSGKISERDKKKMATDGDVQTGIRSKRDGSVLRQRNKRRH